MKLFTLLILLTSLAQANDLKITSWYKLSDNDNNSTAEVCFRVTPAPKKPTFAQVTVDKGTRVEGIYTTFIPTKGRVCQIVSTQRGRVEVQVENYQSLSKTL